MQIRIPDEIELPLERNRMERVFSNLVGNALEMMPEGGRIQISAAAQNGFVVADVRDTGPGIAPEIRGSLFEPFVSAGTKNGLGLALSRQTVLDHGGDMWAESEPGEGACFRVRLPVAGCSGARECKLNEQSQFLRVPPSGWHREGRGLPLGFAGSACHGCFTLNARWIPALQHFFDNRRAGCHPARQ